MNNNTVKTLVVIISLIFILVLINSFYLNQKADRLVNLQLEIVANKYLNKDTDLKLNNIFHATFVNYDELTKSSVILKNNIDLLETKYDDNIFKTIKKILREKNLSMDFIKRANSIISNSVKFISHLHLHSNHSLEELSKELIELSFSIKLSDKLTLQRYEKVIIKLEQIDLEDLHDNEEKNKFLIHSKVILSYSKEMQNYVMKFNDLSNALDFQYEKINNDIKSEYLNTKRKNSYFQVVLFLLLSIFIYMISIFLKLENKHKESEKKLRNIIDKNVITCTIDTRGITQNISKAYSNLSGYKEDELINKLNYTLMQSNNSKEIFDTLELGRTWSGEICDNTKDGEPYWVFSIIEPIYDDKNIIQSYLSISRDITHSISLADLTKNQEKIIESQTKIANLERDNAIKASQSKSEFLANMSHEIRTPLNAISGFIDILRDDENNKKKIEYLNIIDSSSQNLMSIINDILDFSKIESGKLIIDKIDFNPTNEFTLLVKSFMSKFEEKGIELVFTCENLPVGLHGDLLRIKQVINNFLSNAYKFTQKNKKVYLGISYSNANLNVSVKDEGIGISKQYQNKIFDAFSQEDNSTTRRFGGTGLGLSISNNLIKLMKGDLRVNSELNIGSTFSFTLPIEERVFIETTKKTSINLNLNIHILVAEDNKANQMFMKIILKKMNCTFDIANDGLEAIEKFKENQYDIILMDENMPNMSGTDATKEILNIEEEKALRHTPIIALTANALVGDRARFLDAGMDEYLSKPLKYEELHRLISLFVTNSADKK